MKLLTMLVCLALVPSVNAQVTYPPAVVAQVQSSTVMLDSSGNATWVFTPVFAGVPDITHLPRAVDTTNPLICNMTSVTATAVSVHCWRTNLTGLLTGLLGGTVAGAQVNLIARHKPPTP